MRSGGHIICSATLAEKDRESISAPFAMYYMMVKDPDGLYNQEKLSTYKRYKAGLERQAADLKSNVACESLMFLFSSTSYGRRMFSPFHPENACFPLKVMMPDDFAVGAGSERTCQLVLVSREDGGVNFFDMINNALTILYRILTDPHQSLPFAAPFQVQPPAILPALDGTQVLDHAKQALSFFKEHLLSESRNQVRQWELLEQNGDSRLPKRISQEILSLLEEASRNDESNYKYIDCSHLLAYMTHSLMAPPTRAVHGLDLFRRVLIGNKPGLWIVIRGQNSFESAFTKVLSNTYMNFQTTQEFQKWTPDGPDVSRSLQYTKFHVKSSLKGLFIIVLWDDDLQKYQDWYPPYQNSLSEFLKSSLTCSRNSAPLNISTGRMTVRTVSQMGSLQAFRYSRSSSNSPLHSVNRSSPPSQPDSSISPEGDEKAKANEEVRREYYRQASDIRRHQQPKLQPETAEAALKILSGSSRRDRSLLQPRGSNEPSDQSWTLVKDTVDEALPHKKIEILDAKNDGDAVPTTFDMEDFS